jgi:Domain of unknown function (DUF4129)
MTERGPIELIEEATRLFRSAGLATLGLYYIGSLPFVLGFLFFWADMSHDAFAYRSVLSGSFAVALLYLWMNVWQAIYAAELRSRLGGVARAPWTARRILRVAIQQSAVQPTALVLIPIGALLALPFAWIYGFYQNFTVLGDRKQSRAYAVLWTRQSWLVLAIQAAFAIFVSANVAIAMFLVPRLLQMLLGVETVFTKIGVHFLSSTFFAVCLGLTYLCVDPIMKSIYVLRCFYAESVRSGADLRLFEQAKAYSTALLLFVALAQPGSAITAPELDRAIDQVIHQRQYTWRLPRQRAPEAESQKNLVVRFTESAWRAIRRGYRRIMTWLNDWLDDLFRRREVGGGISPAGAVRIGMYFLLVALAAGLGFLLIRALQQRTASQTAVAIAVAAPVDLSAESLVADQLPEEGWRGLAKEWIARNDFRMAMRALYLASLAYLGERDLIRIHRGKSNRDYYRELDRRARSTPELAVVFGQNLAVFESCWYGRGEIGLEAIDAFAANLDRMKAYAK